MSIINSRAARKESSGAQGRQGLGTFLGVYTPSVLTILGVILFLRTGWVVGNVGLASSLLIILLAHVITVSTAFSVSAVATNMRVGVGGAYFMISRSLGLEIGGAIGIPLFLAQTFSVTLYAFGFAESLQLLWPQLPGQLTAAATVVFVSLIGGRSTKLALKLQLPILVAIGLALASLFAGAASSSTESLPLWQRAEGGESFWRVFAVFFPAVTGIMAGISLSGDLRDAKKSLPRGTILAVATGFVVYLSVPIALALSSEPEVLVSDNLVWFSVAAVPLVIYPALWGAILSSALGSILGAPRTLQALVGDRVVPRLPGKVLGVSVPHLLSAAVALGAVLLGDLNAVAPVLTMFFLTTYGMVNLVAGLEQLSGSPSYRPTIQVPWAVSIGGALACVGVMWLIHPVAAVAAIVVELLIYLGLRRRALSRSWGDARYGTLMSLARVTLLKLKEMPVDPRNWRPHILVFAGDVEKRLDLVRFAAWLNQGRGILTVCELLEGEIDDLAPVVAERTRKLQSRLDEATLLAFAEVDVTSDFEAGVIQVAQANGLAGIASNTLMFGLSEKPERSAAQLRIVRRAALLGKSSLLCRITPRRWTDSLSRIDVWWGGLQSNGDMLLLFSHLVAANPEWSQARISVKAITTNEMTYEQTERNLTELLARSRIEASMETIRKPEGQSVQDIIHTRSRGADLVLMGLRCPKVGQEEHYAARLESLVGKLPTVILVHAAGPFAGLLLEQTADGDESQAAAGDRAAAPRAGDLPGRRRSAGLGPAR